MNSNQNPPNSPGWMYLGTEKFLLFMGISGLLVLASQAGRVTPPLLPSPWGNVSTCNRVGIGHGENLICIFGEDEAFKDHSARGGGDGLTHFPGRRQQVAGVGTSMGSPSTAMQGSHGPQLSSSSSGMEQPLAPELCAGIQCWPSYLLPALLAPPLPQPALMDTVPNYETSLNGTPPVTVHCSPLIKHH